MSVSRTVEELMLDLRSRDIRLALEGAELRVNAPKGALSAELRDELIAMKPQILAALQRNASITRLPRGTDFALSHAQQRLWFMKQMDPDSNAYSVPCAVRFKGHLEPELIASALNGIAARHESLRTHFVAVDGAPRCVVDPQCELRLERLDLTHLPASEAEEAALQELRATFSEPFDLARAPLARAVLIRVASDHWMLGLVMDHIVTDGISLAIVLGELQRLYVQQLRGAAAVQPLQDLRIQYVDYAHWQRRSFADGALARSLVYWDKQLAGELPVLQLPSDRPRPPVQTFDGRRPLVKFPLQLSLQIKRLARQEQATLYMVLLGALQILLHRYTGESDILVGTAVANREREELQGIVGCFVNNIVLRGDLSGNPTVHELLRRTRETTLSAFDHQDMPFDQLVDRLAPRRELAHPPLFQVMLVVQNVVVGVIDLPDVQSRVMPLDLGTARLDLSMDVLDVPDDGMYVYFEYNSDVFDAPMIDALIGHYRTLLEALVATPDARIDEMPMLTALEQRQLLQLATGSVIEPVFSTAIAQFEKQVLLRGNGEAVRFENTSLSYTELNQRANQLARHLLQQDVQRGDLLGVYLERGIDMVVALLGILKAGAAYVPLDPAFPQDRIEFMVQDAQLRCVVTQDSLTDLLGQPGLLRIHMDADRATIESHTGENLPLIAGAQDLAYVIYTSGSTGRPKGVELQHGALANFLASMHVEPAITAQDRLVAVTTLSFDIAGLEIHGPLTIGGTVVLASRAAALDGLALAALIDLSAATILQATPATWRLLLDSGWQGRAGLKMLCGGEALPRELARGLLETGGELWNMYGPTETTIWSTVTRVIDTSRSIAIGRPIANTTIYILEPSGLLAPQGVPGELCIGGAGLARSYLRRAELTAEKFVTITLPDGRKERVYRTGDLARWRWDGELEFIGRRDHQVKLRGFRIELGEIESVLATHSSVSQCAVIVREDVPGDQRLVAYVVSVDARALDTDALRTMLRTKLPEYMIPNLFVMLGTLPLTPNAKVDRKALPIPEASLEATPEDLAGGEITMTTMQRRVAGIWKDVLRVERIPLHVNFFDLGGHSLLLVKLQAGLQREFGTSLPLVDLFRRTTIAAQAERLGSTAPDDTALKRARAIASRQINV
ncbi:MAG: amino acid adenylation domain-containing protein [Pseudomonadota bacterium]